jgi:hypothetical protein
MSKPRLIAFYLPQFYPTPENDEWWQKGFTEWTNVGNAKPLFRGHYQPRVPADLGYYDLRLPEVREEQARLAREAGIEGFCYWHYWFAGRRLLDRVFTEVVGSGKPDFPFCLCWANHSWFQKTWDPTKPDKLLIEQTYPSEQDYIDHFNAMLPAFKDKRYIRVNGKLLFGLFSTNGISKEQFQLMSSIWDDLARENGLVGFEFFGFTFESGKYIEILDKGFDRVVIDYTMEMLKSNNWLSIVTRRILRSLTGRPNKVYNYQSYTDFVLNHIDTSKKIYPCVVPNFDHSPRSSNRGYILHKSTPEKWASLCKKLFSLYIHRPHEENLIFIKAWNEWGEGNYLEPDLKYGKGYIKALRNAYDQTK